MGWVGEGCGLGVAATAALLGLAAGAAGVAVGLAELPWHAASSTAASAN